MKVDNAHHQFGFTLIESLIALALLSIICGSLIYSNPTVALNNTVVGDKLFYSLTHARRVALQSRCPVKVTISNDAFEANQQSACGSATGYNENSVFDMPLAGLSFVVNNSEKSLRFYPSLALSETLFFLADGSVSDITGSPSSFTFTLNNRTIAIDGITGHIGTAAL
jgi:prepilin-type N-terminal cleavage/methylation domain-containing protein